MRIIKKKKGKKEYFYLKKSFRKGNKVLTKEKYLGKKIPENIDEIKREFQKELYQNIERIRDNFQREWKKLPEVIKEKEKQERVMLLNLRKI